MSTVLENEICRKQEQQFVEGNSLYSLKQTTSDFQQESIHFALVSIRNVDKMMTKRKALESGSMREFGEKYSDPMSSSLSNETHCLAGENK